MNQPPPGFGQPVPPLPHSHHVPLPPPIPSPQQPQNGYVNGSHENSNGSTSINGAINNNSTATTTTITAGNGAAAGTDITSDFDLSSYVYNAGFIHAAWADTFLNIPPHPPLRLHALFASRSPLLYNILSNYAATQGGPPYHINLTSDDKYLTSAALSLAIATLYGHSLDIQSFDLELSKGLLSAGSLLGLDDVSSTGYQSLLNQLSKDTLAEILEFALSSPKINHHQPRAEAGNTTPLSSPGPNTNPSSSRSSPDLQQTVATEDIQITYPGPYPRFTSSLLSIIVEFILANFQVSQRPIDPTFKELFLTLPFYVYKNICESDRLSVRSHMERHSFAREMTSLREQYRKKNASSSGRSVIYEENVVLAFGGGKGGVEVIRKPIGKKKTLWKASQ